MPKEIHSKSVVGIKTTQIGSAVKVEFGGEHYLMTCLHNLSNDYESLNVGDKIAVKFLEYPVDGPTTTASGDNGRTYGEGVLSSEYELEIESLDKHADYALLSSPSELRGLLPAKIAIEDIALQDTLSCYGYPQGLFDVELSTKDRVVPAMIERFANEFVPNSGDKWLACGGGPSLSGMSGGGVFDINGHLVGLIKARLTDPPERTMVIVLSALKLRVGDEASAKKL